MPDTAIVSRVPRFTDGMKVLEHYTSGALTAAAVKKEWIVTGYYSIRQVIVDSETANVGNGVDRIDINVNGTSIYSATADKPVLQQGDTGMWASSHNLATRGVVPGDVISYDVDNVAGGSGSARVKVCIVLGTR